MTFINKINNKKKKIKSLHRWCTAEWMKRFHASSKNIKTKIHFYQKQKKNNKNIWYNKNSISLYYPSAYWYCRRACFCRMVYLYGYIIILLYDIIVLLYRKLFTFFQKRIVLNHYLNSTNWKYLFAYFFLKRFRSKLDFYTNPLIKCYLISYLKPQK